MPTFLLLQGRQERSGEGMVKGFLLDGSSFSGGRAQGQALVYLHVHRDLGMDQG